MVLRLRLRLRLVLVLVLVRDDFQTQHYHMASNTAVEMRFTVKGLVFTFIEGYEHVQSESDKPCPRNNLGSLGIGAHLHETLARKGAEKKTRELK